MTGPVINVSLVHLNFLEVVRSLCTAAAEAAERGDVEQAARPLRLLLPLVERAQRTGWDLKPPRKPRRRGPRGLPGGAA